MDNDLFRWLVVIMLVLIWRGVADIRKRLSRKFKTEKEEQTALREYQKSIANTGDKVAQAEDEIKFPSHVVGKNGDLYRLYEQVTGDQHTPPERYPPPIIAGTRRRARLSSTEPVVLEGLLKHYNEMTNPPKQ